MRGGGAGATAWGEELGQRRGERSWGAAPGEELGGGTGGEARVRRQGRSWVAMPGEELWRHTSASLFHGVSAGTRDRDGER
jgi:hypothetical protein